jgi:hypothetical protein
MEAKVIVASEHEAKSIVAEAVGYAFRNFFPNNYTPLNRKPY